MSTENPCQDARTLQSIHNTLDMVWTDLFATMSGEHRLKVLEAMKDLQKIADKLSQGDF